MGIGRRAFLELFGAGIAALTINPSSAIALVGEHYINRRLGVAFRKPPGWTFADMTEMEDVKAGQILDLEDPAMARELVNSMELPILCLTKERLSAESKCFTPGINVYLDHSAPTEEGGIRDALIKLLRSDLESMCDVLRDFEIIREPTLVWVSNCEGVEATATCIFEHQNLDEAVPIRLRTLVIDQGATTYTIRMYDAPLLGSKMTFDYESFIQSIKLV